MSWSTLPESVRQIVEHSLTDKQREAFELEVGGWGMMRIAKHLGITKGAVDSRIHGAHIKLHKAGVRQDPFGTWYIKEEVAA